MDVRNHIQSGGSSPVTARIQGQAQYVNTVPVVPLELVQFLEERYPDSLHGLNVRVASHATVVFHAGTVAVVRFLRDTFEEQQKSRNRQVNELTR